MNKLIACAILFAVIPMTLLNPLGRPAFIGYYAGVIACWAVFVFAFASLKAKSDAKKNA